VTDDITECFQPEVELTMGRRAMGEDEEIWSQATGT